MQYQQRLNQVIDYIGAHLDDELKLDHLCRIACMSKYHFHRIFTVFTGLSLQQYIRWLRLKRSAHQLIVEPKQSILEIALNAGFESHESYTKAFKRVCGVSPKVFRENHSWQNWETPPYKLEIMRVEKMNVEIQEKPERRLAVMEHRGDPRLVGDSVNKLVQWARAQPINVKPSPGDAFGFAYDDPKLTPAEDFRFDLALTVPENLTLQGGVFERRLPKGRYAVAVHKGSRENIQDTFYYMYKEWLPASGEELADLPGIFCYYNFDHEVADTELLTECWFLLK